MNNNEKNFIINYSKKIGLRLSSTISVNDIYNSAYILSSENNKKIIDNLPRIIWSEKYMQIADMQKGGLIPNKYEKQCNHCKEFKNQTEYKHRFSTSGNFNYLNFICNECERKYQSNWHKKKYAEDIEYRERIKQQSREYKLRNKLKK